MAMSPCSCEVDVFVHTRIPLLVKPRIPDSDQRRRGNFSMIMMTYVYSTILIQYSTYSIWPIHVQSTLDKDNVIKITLSI
jgi:hypothetical protein